MKPLIRINLIKTLYFNFRMFPFKTAIRFPIVFYGRCQIVADGRINLNIKPCFGVLRIGENQSLSYGIKGSHSELTYFRLSGVLDIDGYNNNWANGCKVYVKRGGELSLNGNLLLSNRSKIHCANRIIVGANCRISWETQVFDTNMHYMIDRNGLVKNNKGTIIIGNNCWIGNRCTIQKGTVLPDSTIVASNSLVNKDFSNQPAGIVAGSPANLIKPGYKRVFDYKTERILDKFFQENPTAVTVSLCSIL